MFKEILRNAIEGEEVSITLKSRVRRLGGIDTVSEEKAEELCKKFDLVPEDVSPTTAAYREWMELESSVKYLKSCRAELGEAHDFGEMCGYDDFNDTKTYGWYTAEIGKAEARMEEIRSLASEGARALGRRI